MSNDEPFIDTDRVQLLNIRQASRLLTSVARQTLRDWAVKGPPFQFDLDIRSVPYVHDPRGLRRNAKYHRGQRIMLPCGRVMALKQILESVGRKKTGPWTFTEVAAAEEAVRANRLGHELQHGQNSP